MTAIIENAEPLNQDQEQRREWRKPSVTRMWATDARDGFPGAADDLFTES